MTQVDTVHLLREGIAAARNGDKTRTRALLQQVTDADPTNELAWLWQANAASEPADAVRCLRRVLDLNPTNGHAATALPDALVRAGAAASKANDADAALAYFTEATELSPRNETAWLWRAGLAKSPQEAIEQLDFVLSINPHNDRARQGLAHYRALLAPKWQCPFCGTGGDRRPGANCPKCRAVLTLDDPSAFDSGHVGEKSVLEAAARRLYGEYQREPGSQKAYDLGLAYLNLGFIDEGLQAVQAAVRGKSADPAWKSLVAELVQHRAELAKPRTGKPSAPTVIVVDDSPTIRKLVSVTLGGYGYRVVEASDGYDVAEKIGQVGAPNLIILDVNMPGLDGFQVCKMLRQNAETANVPVIFLTGKDGFFNKLRGQWAGAAEYLTKPFDPQRLLAAVGKLVPAPQAVGGV
jgi:twitching motility two-component system response regulator PilG